MKAMWLNLTVKDIARSKSFYAQLGFHISENETYKETMFSIEVGSGMQIIFIEQQDFKDTTGQTLDPHCNEAMVSIGVSDEAEMVAMLTRITEAGGQICSDITTQRGTQVAYFKDLDGHAFNLVVC